jgi:uncharacterized membrane protein
MSDEDKSTDEEHATSDIEKKAKNIGAKIVELGNKKYFFNFSINGWIIGIVALLILVLIFK